MSRYSGQYTSKEESMASRSLFFGISDRVIILRALTVPICLLIWELLARSHVYNSQLFPPPSQVILTLWGDLRSGLLFLDMRSSISRVVVGYVSGAVVGIAFGLVTGRSAIARATVGQVFQLLRPIPPISLVPIVILWFGLGEFPKYFLVFFGVFFPVWINTHLGVANVEQSYVWTAQSMGASPANQIFNVYLPAAAPLILAGLRVAIATAFFCLVAAEIAGASSGLAFRIELSHLVFRVDRMFADLIVLGVLSAAADQVLAYSTRRLFPWAQPRAVQNEQ
jgi:ABC-type nitrate/sulfonate/bicarbonate transport system permease component